MVKFYPNFFKFPTIYVTYAAINVEKDLVQTPQALHNDFPFPQIQGKHE